MVYIVMGLLSNHWFLIEEGGLGWDRMAVTLFSQCDRKLLNKSPASVRLKSRKVILLSWKSEIDSLNVR